VAVVVIAYGMRDQTPAETGLLEGMGFQVRHLAGLPGQPGAELADASALLVTVQPVTRDVLAAMPECKIISRVGSGLDSIDLDAAAERGVLVTNVPDYSIDEVSTQTIALLLAWARRLPQYLDLVQAGQWSSTGGGEIRRLAGTTLGIAGFGRIGRAAAAKALGLGLRVLAFDAYLSAAEIEAAGVTAVDWPGLLAESDYLSLHLPLTPQSRHMINGSALAAMKPSALLINTARGDLVDEAALAAALDNGVIAGAALDVLSEEPPPASHPLLSNPRVLLTPHSGWYSFEAQQDVAAWACDEVQRALSGQPPRSPANAPAPAPGTEAAR
jgi:D-3-phosphoglycerate dehydrogenase / 2-oxoglutarate reductase